MEFVCNCANCGKTIEKDFIYCPWCGKKHAQETDKEIFENVMKILEVKQSDNRNFRVKKIEQKIHELEDFFDNLLEKKND